MAEPEFVLQSINVESRIHYSTDRADVALGFGEFIVRQEMSTTELYSWYFEMFYG